MSTHTHRSSLWMHFYCKTWKYYRWALNLLNNQPNCLMCFPRFARAFTDILTEYFILHKWFHTVHIVLQPDFSLIACLRNRSVTIPATFVPPTAQHSRACPDPSWLHHLCWWGSPFTLVFHASIFHTRVSALWKEYTVSGVRSRGSNCSSTIYQPCNLGQLPASPHLHL